MSEEGQGRQGRQGGASERELVVVRPEPKQSLACGSRSLGTPVQRLREMQMNSSLCFGFGQM